MNGQTDKNLYVHLACCFWWRQTLMKFCLKSLGEFPMCYEPIPNSFIWLRCLKKPRFSSPTSHYPSLFPLPQSIPHTNVWSHPDVWCPLTRASFLLLDFSYSAFWQDHPTDLLILFRIFLFKVLFFFFPFKCSMVYM